jgi:uncharacterized membrane protein
MRSIVLLFAIAAIGFSFILHKKDAAEATATKSAEVSRHNWMKHALDKTRTVAQNVSQQRRENGVP